MSKNIVRDLQTSGSFLDQLQTTRAVAESFPAAQVTRTELKQKFNKAYEDGHLAGYAEGHAQGEAKGMEAGYAVGVAQAHAELDATHAEMIAAFAQDMQAMVTKTQADIAAWYVEAEARLAKLGIEIAQRAISHELLIHPEAVVEIAKDVLREVTNGTSVRLRVNPVQTAVLDSRKDDIIAAISHIRDLEIVGDPSIHNGCVAEGESGVVDGRIETYFGRLAETIDGEAA